MTDFDQVIALGMSALLDNSETRSAIVEYIKAITEKAKPQTEHWREICYFQSEEVRIDPEENRITLRKNMKCRLLVIGFWDIKQEIGNLRAYQVGAADYNPRNAYLRETIYFMDGFGRGDIANDVFNANSYMDVFKMAKGWFDTALVIWKAKTEALPSNISEDNKP